jgi:DNA-binding transcriptional ArsR family regulator
MSVVDGYEAAGELLRALAAPLRVAIITELAGDPRCVHELVDTLQAPQPLVSQHLRVLRKAGIVRGARRGREIEYSLTDEHIAHIVADAVSHSREGTRRLPSDASPAAPQAGTPRPDDETAPPRTATEIATRTPAGITTPRTAAGITTPRTAAGISTPRTAAEISSPWSVAQRTASPVTPWAPDAGRPAPWTDRAATD